MHGRLKIRTTEEQRALKQREQLKKLTSYQMGMEKILSSRIKKCYDSDILSICSQLLVVNPDIYTLWNYRKEVINMKLEESKKTENVDDLLSCLEEEIRFTEQCLLANPKSYGAWHHRYWVLIHHPNPKWEREFLLCTRYLKMDDRNFHCWDFRRLLVNKIGISLSDELQFSQNLLNENFSNYSSWHYRSTLQKINEENVDHEITLVQNAVFTDPADSSAWFYLRWVLSNPSISKERKQELLEAFEQLEELEPDCKWIIMAKCWLTGSLVLSDKEYVDRRIEFYERLIQLDPMRKGQYEYYLNLGKQKALELNKF